MATYCALKLHLRTGNLWLFLFGTNEKHGDQFAISVKCSICKMKLTKCINNFIAHDESQASKYHLTEQMLEESTDRALAKADFDWDGYISWDEYVYSLGDKEVAEHIKHEQETHGAMNQTKH